MSALILSTLCTCFFAGVLQGVTGFGAAMVMVPLLCLFLDLKGAILLGLLSSFGMQIYQMIELRNLLSVHKILPLFAGGLPGILVGIAILKYVDNDRMKVFVGVTLICYCIYNLVAKPGAVKMSFIWQCLAGFFGGLLTSAVGIGGLPIVIYCALTSWSKNEIKATMIGFFILINIFTLTIYYFNDFFSLQLVKLFAYSIPASVIGTGIGMYIAGKINREMYLTLVYYLIGLLGLMMFFQ